MTRKITLRVHGKPSPGDLDFAYRCAVRHGQEFADRPSGKGPGVIYSTDDHACHVSWTKTRSLTAVVWSTW